MKQFVAMSADYLDKIKFGRLYSTEHNLIHDAEIEILILKYTFPCNQAQAYVTI